MRSIVVTITALLLGSAALNLGLGLQASLLGIRAGIEGFPTLMIGLIMSAYYVGFIVGTMVCPRIIMRVGHIRAFAAMASLASAAALCHAVFPLAEVWLVIRGLTGFCLACLVMVAESWLNAKAVNLNRGSILSLYMIVINLSTAGGQLMLNLAEPGGYELFILVSIVLSLSLVPLSLSTSSMPAISEVTRMGFRQLFQISPVGFIGCLGTGLMTGAFWGLGAVFAKGIQLSVYEVSLFMTAAILGGAAFQWPLGWISDRLDRRWAITGLCVGIAATAALVGLSGAAFGTVFLTGAVAFGMALLPLYAVVVAHANDRMEAGQFLNGSAALLFLYGIGACLGPALGSVFMDIFGPRGLMAFMAAIALALGGYTLYRKTRREAVPVEETAPHVVAALKTTPMAYELDPRAYEDEP